jgi:hypothetical protein
MAVLEIGVDQKHHRQLRKFKNNALRTRQNDWRKSVLFRYFERQEYIRSSFAHVTDVGVNCEAWPMDLGWSGGCARETLAVRDKQALK